MSAPSPKLRILIRTVIILAVLLAAAVVLLNRVRPTAVVATVKRGTAADIVTGSVVVHAEKDLQPIKSELPGRVVWIDPRQLGQPFEAGEPILKLDSTELELEMKRAEGDFNRAMERLRIERQNDPRLQVAKEALENAEREFARNFIGGEQLKAVRRAFEEAQTEVALEEFDAKQARIVFEEEQAARKRRLEKMTIRAPMDGVLQAVMVAQGALIGEGTTVATFFSNERVVIAKVGEEDVGKVKIGQPARVRLLNLAGETFDAKVSTILPFADADTQRYSVYLDVQADPSKLMPFSTGEATITVGERENQPLIPRRALFNDNYVFVVKDGVVEKRQVSTGFKALNYAEVTAHLAEGEQVIVEDIDRFRDGQRVRAEEAK